MLRSSVVSRVARLARLRATPPQLCLRNFSCKSRLVPVWRPRSLVDDFFRSPFSPSRLMEQQMRLMEHLLDEAGFVRSRGEAVEGMEVKYNAREYEVKVDVSDYKPEELTVKVMGDNLSITGKHGEKSDEHGVISRQFSRQLLIPNDVEADTIESILTNEGVLVIKGHVKGSENIEARTINIEREKDDSEKS